MTASATTTMEMARIARFRRATGRPRKKQTKSYLVANVAFAATAMQLLLGRRHHVSSLMITTSSSPSSRTSRHYLKLSPQVNNDVSYDTFDSTPTDAGRLLSGPSSDRTKLLKYEHNGFDLTYRMLRLDNCNMIDNSGRGTDNDDVRGNTNIILIHPIGVGLASWFWKPFMGSLASEVSQLSFLNKSNKSVHVSAVYAPNLIGCGISEGSAIWNPNTKGLFIPLDWVRGCEELMNHASRQQRNPLDTATSGNTEDGDDEWIVIAQGGLAPIGVLLAHRNPDRVTNLVLTSPPRWKEMTTPVPEKELKRNLGFLTNAILGDIAFALLESRKAVEFFSNQFLFSKPCDPEWLDCAQTEWEVGGRAARSPVQMFNSGFCMNRSYEEELTSIEQPTLVVQGVDDKRQRIEYSSFMRNCVVKSIPGQNVLPWEQPRELVQALSSFLSESA